MSCGNHDRRGRRVGGCRRKMPERAGPFDRLTGAPFARNMGMVGAVSRPENSMDTASNRYIFLHIPLLKLPPY